MDKESDESSSATAVNGTISKENKDGKRSLSASDRGNRGKSAKSKTSKVAGSKDRESKERELSPVAVTVPAAVPSPAPVAENVDEILADDDFPNTWECSVCTFRNSPEAFKCLMCDVRKGTSTRKPRINPMLVAQQVARQQQQIQQQAIKASAKQAEKDSKGPSLPEDKVERLPKTEEKDKKTDGKRPVSPSTPTSTSNEKRRNSDVDLPSPGPSVKSSSSTSSKKEKKKKAVDLDGEGSSTTTYSVTSSKPTTNGRTKLKNIDRNNTSSKAVTVNNVTVIITEFQPKKTNYSSS